MTAPAPPPPTLADRLLRPGVLAEPERIAASAWLEHIPFAFWLVEALRPRSLVELGTHTGVSYCAFLQAAAALGLDLQATAVDTWAGDAHSGGYGADVLADLEAHHARYTPGSRLLRATFDEALGSFPDGSLDLIHIDGCHTYEAVRHDFEAWAPKLGPRGVALFHDTAERRGDFGVWQLWDEMSARYPTFAFEHGHGLGVALIGPEAPEEVVWLAGLGREEAGLARAFFAALGARHSAEVRGRDLAAAEGAMRAAAAEAAARAAAEFDAATAVLGEQARVLEAQARYLDANAGAVERGDAFAQQAAVIARQADLIARSRRDGSTDDGGAG